ncbi:MAG: hypothetical protein HFF18_09200 [Oscillospiraceae bacterium]|nr:hypothetical protein [Oscillospiraceae bacterium]
MNQADSSSTWYRLDNAALIFPAIQKENYSSIYRFSAVMTQPVDPAALQRAVDRTMPRFPSFGVRIRRGTFWYYLEPNPAPGPFVRADIANPCQPVRFKEDNGWLIRFFYYEQRISIEVFHALSDGAGALVLFRTLLAAYLGELGFEIPLEKGVLDLNGLPMPEELEDAYQKYATSGTTRGMGDARAYPATGTPEPFYTLNTTIGFVPVDQVKAAAGRYDASITEYLSAVLLESLTGMQAAEKPKRLLPVALAVPINLRGWFPSQTLRNFILNVRPSVDPALGEFSFEELVSQVHHYMRLTINRQRLRAQLTRNVKFQQNRLIQIAPLVLKDLVMAIVYRFVGSLPYSAVFTNPGVFAVPEAMEPHIQRMEVILGQAYESRTNCAAISYGNTLAISFAGTIVETELEKRFFRHLVRDGIPVRIESNR